MDDQAFNVRAWLRISAPEKGDIAMSTPQAPGWQTPALHLSRRNFVAAMGAAGLLFLPKHAAADEMIDLGLPGGGGERPVTTAFPQKGKMILQRTRPPL